ncbi:hypothetical protein BpHYR1_050979 [Brachionus plicatilis]|uniref:Uncharacterized protein n=1 Tax=Brachionus plicatilis TaxID=10195 RepID=A0A3M7QX78_BRAPC|nr:hypothetical protein BpHYR1_050979 [Brachionus plicatilis]
MMPLLDDLYLQPPAANLPYEEQNRMKIREIYTECHQNRAINQSIERECRILPRWSSSITYSSPPPEKHAFYQLRELIE